MRKISYLLILAIVFTCIYSPVGSYADENDGLVVSYWEEPPINPPDVHPRVFFTADKIDGIRANIDAEENAVAKDLFLKYVNVGLSDAGITVKTNVYDELPLAQIEACAFYYAIYKGTDLDVNAQKAGQEAVDSISIIQNMTVDETGDHQRRWGRMLNVLTEVYDWCYPLIEGNTTLIESIVSSCDFFMKKLEIWDGVNDERFNGAVSENYNPYYSPGSLSPVNGHGVEKENLRDLLSFAIAFSDVRPDVWRAFGGRFYQKFVPAREFLIKSGYYQTGTDYGIAREYATACAYFLITGMGAEEPWSGEEMARLGYADIYLRRPDGAMLYDGDVYTDTLPPFTYSANSHYNPFHMYAAAAAEEDAGYIKSEYFKMGFDMNSAQLAQTFYEKSPILNLIINNPDIKVKVNYDLPNSKYFPSPAGVMTARTGWDEGIDSSAVIANMKINEYGFAGHQHNDSGHFTIYYKGLLAADGGNYKHFGDKEHYMYTKKSIAHNTMLIYDPSEGNFTDISATNINDGGQVTKYNGAASKSIEEFTSKARNKGSDVLAYEIDPENTKEPFYTYLKGELENAYYDGFNYPSRRKVKEFKRSFMFLDLKQEKIPAALIVFDKVVSTDAKFKKMWLLHGVNQPQLDKENQVTVFKNTDGEYNGQMVTKTLLPKNADFDVVGGLNNWGVVRGWKYNDTTKKWDITNSVNYGASSTADKTENNERNTYRIEVSPNAPSEEDHFLNVILIGDGGEQIDANVPLYEDNEDFYGTKVKDRVVFFSRDGVKKNEFSYNTNLSGAHRYTICDMEKGTYTITAGSESFEEAVSEEGGVLSFVSSFGNINAVKKNDEYILPADMSKTKNNNFRLVKKGSAYIKAAEENEAGEAVWNVSALSELMGYTAKEEAEDGKVKVLIYDGLEKIAEIKEGEKVIRTKSGTYEAVILPFTDENGSLCMGFEELSGLLNFSSRYLPYTNTYFIYNPLTKAGTLYASGNIRTTSGVVNLTINAKVYNAFKAKVYVSVIKDKKVLDMIELFCMGNGCYAGKIDVTAYEDFPDYSGYEVKVYAWGDELHPFEESMTAVFPKLTNDVNYGPGTQKPGYTHHSSEYRDNGDGYMYSTSNTTRVRNGAKSTINRSKNTADCHIKTFNQNSHYMFEETKGIMHYSTNLKINKLSNENEKIYTRVRGTKITGASGVLYVEELHDAFEGSETKIDVIVDFNSDKCYVFENGVKTNEKPIAHWSKNTTIDHGVTNGGGIHTKTEFEIFDSSMRYYAPDTDINTIINSINQFCILK